MCIIANPLSFLIPHKINNTDSFSTVVGYSSGSATVSAGKWYFSSWKNGYSETSFTTLSEPITRRPQVLLSDSATGRIIRIFYGKDYPGSDSIQLDVIRPKRDEKSGAIVFDRTPDSQRISISWRGLIERDYLLWFVHDVDGDGFADLVAYTSDASNTFLNVVVFPSKADGLFKAPVVSPIQVDPSIGKRFTAAFMQPLYTTRATYTYAATGETTTGAILSFFDNYGIIAARMIAPGASRGSFRYELKGQEPAIAGQRALTLGERPGNWMGLDRRTQRIGIVPV